MPKIGMRIVKSAIAVFICFLIYFIRGDGIPFYSAIAAILCMQPYVANSKKVAWNRTIGTIVGGIFGMFVLVFQKRFIPEDLIIIQYFLDSICIIPLIYITLLLEKPRASYITCVVFLSITVSHGGDVNPYGFALNRIMDTLLGIFVSLAVNSFHFPRKKNLTTLFLGNVKELLLTPEKSKSYNIVKLNHMLQAGALISLDVEEIEPMLNKEIQELDFKLPIMVMNGAALYNVKEKKYSYCKYIDYSNAKSILAIFNEHNINAFVYTIVNDILHVYYGDFKNQVEKNFYYSKRLTPLQNYVYGSLGEEKGVICIKGISSMENIKTIYEKIMSLKISENLKVNYYEDKENQGYYFLEVFSHEASKENALKELKTTSTVEKTVVFLSDMDDLSMVKEADYTITSEKAPRPLKEVAGEIIDSNKGSAIKSIERLFYSKDLIKNK